MIDFQGVSLCYGAQDVLWDVSFRINAGDRIGIVGPNGAGKTTIFQLITGDLTPDDGEIILPKNARIGYLRQHLKPSSVDATILAHTEDAVASVRNIEEEIESIEEMLHTLQGVERDRMVRRLGELQTQFENLGGYDLSTRAKAALGGLGFSVEDFHRPFRTFSGGWQMRSELARALVARPDILLLDEPTNFLDIPAIEWLQRFLREFEGTLLLISHDRYLLNTLTTTTLEVMGAQCTRYAGNYDYYVRERVTRYDQLIAAKDNQDRRKEQIERFIERFRAKNTKSTQVQSRVKQLEKMDEIVVPQIMQRTARIHLPDPPSCGLEVARLENAGLSYDGLRWILRGAEVRIERGEKTALVGMNGLGKTTLLKMLGGVLPLTEGKRFIGHNVVMGYQAQNFAETMPPEKTVLEVAKASAPDRTENQVRTMLGSFLFSGDAIEKTVRVLSGGEKMRLALCRLLFTTPNFLLLDEPTTHLDIASREILEKALQEYEGTVLIVSHDIQFVRNVATNIIAMAPPVVQRYYGGYEYYKEKLAQEISIQPPVRPVGQSDDNPNDRKAQRRERAQRRQEVGKELKPLQTQVRKAEDRIAALEIEQVGLVDQLAGGQNTDYGKVNRRLHEIQIDIHNLTQQWEQASMAIEKIRKEAGLDED